MKAQTKALVASVVVIALALSAVSGITYSWWSDTEQTDITVKTGNLDVSTSNFKVYVGGDLKHSAETVPSAYSIFYGVPYTGDIKEGLSLDTATVDPDDPQLKISYDVTFKADVKVKYLVDVSVPSGITAATTVTSGENDESSILGSYRTDETEALNTAYSVVIDITKLDQGVSGKLVLTNYITQSANPNALALSSTVSGSSGDRTAAVSDGMKTSVTATSLPDDASSFNVVITTNDTERKAFLDLTLTGSDGSRITEFGNPVQITTVLKGAYNGIYYNGDAAQPTGTSYKYSTDGETFDSTDFADAKYTQITFKTTHFSEFVAVKSSVTTADELVAAIAEGGFVKLGGNITDVPSILIQKDAILDLGGYSVTFVGEDSGTDNWNIKVQKGAELDVTGAERSAMKFSKSWGFRVYGELTIDGDVAFSNAKTGDSVIVGTAGVNAQITINGGTFTAASLGQAVYTLDGGKITINDGAFVDTRTDLSHGWLLNMNNDRIGNASITVYGGTFTNYDPSTGDDASKNGKTAGTFVAVGYVVTSSTDGSENTVYTVSAGSS